MTFSPNRFHAFAIGAPWISCLDSELKLELELELKLLATAKVKVREEGQI